MTANQCSVEFFAPYTEHVGTKATMERLADGLAGDEYEVALIRVYREWHDTSSERLVALDSPWSTAAINRLPFPWKKLFLASIAFTRLVRHLRNDPPDVLVAGLLSGIAVAARDAAGSETRVLISIQGLPQLDRLRSTIWPRWYPLADGIVAPVESIAERVAQIAAIDRDRIAIEPNPVITDAIVELGSDSPDHPYFDEDAPVIVAVGRQTRQKDFETLLRAFAEVHDERDARLLIVGKEGDQSAKLRNLVAELNLGAAVTFPGFVDNPYAFMRAADVFVLSSKWEGPGHVLLEAMALGTPVIATDCPLGPREILRDGEAGVLVPVGDHAAMADGVRMLLDNPSIRAENVEVGKTVADRFHVDRAVSGYRDHISSLCRET